MSLLTFDTAVFAIAMLYCVNLQLVRIFCAERKRLRGRVAYLLWTAANAAS